MRGWLLSFFCVLHGLAHASSASPLTVSETHCVAQGWKLESFSQASLTRSLLWKGPAVWTQGVILVLHGGGGAAAHFCHANHPLINAQVRFAEKAIAKGFAVVLLESSDAVTDSAGRLCGKVWDDNVLARPNIDLPYIGHIIRTALAQWRPAGSSTRLFISGLSSGGFMTVRAATHFVSEVTAFAPVAAGDPYGWYRDCTRRPGDRQNVAGAGKDRETHKTIPERGSCEATSYPNEAAWDSAVNANLFLKKPKFRLIYHRQDAIVDESCVLKLRRQLLAHQYPEAEPFVLDNGFRRLGAHFWQEAYDEEILRFFEQAEKP
jgi:hypothetical protein